MISPRINNMKWHQMAQMAETVVEKYIPIAKIMTLTFCNPVYTCMQYRGICWAHAVAQLMEQWNSVILWCTLASTIHTPCSSLLLSSIISKAPSGPIHPHHSTMNSQENGLCRTELVHGKKTHSWRFWWIERYSYNFRIVMNPYEFRRIMNWAHNPRLPDHLLV